MGIDIFSKNIELNDPLRVFIEEKIGTLMKYLKGDGIGIRVEVSRPSKHHRSGDVFYAEANIKMGGKLIRATAENRDLHTAVTEVRDELQIQLKKLKDKKLSSRR